MKILYIDSFMAAIEKPPNMPSQPDKTGDEDLLTLLQKETGYAALINRLDRGVGGIIIFALNKQAASKMQASTFEKQYKAVVCGKPINNSEKLADWLLKNQRLNKSFVVAPGTKGSKEARLTYKAIARAETKKYGSLALLDVFLETGRHHQIRAQLSNKGLPIWGDIKYNQSFCKGGGFYKAALDEGMAITPALWSYSLSCPHPITGEKLAFKSVPTGYPFNLFPLI